MASRVGARLQITESVLPPEVAGDRPPSRQRLKDLGVSIVIDDFGTGFSSLGYLNHFPIDRRSSTAASPWRR